MVRGECPHQQIVAMVMKEPTWTHAALAKWTTAQFKLGSPIDRTMMRKCLRELIKSIYQRLPSKEVKDDVSALPELEAALLCWLDKTNASEMSVAQSMVREEAPHISRSQQIDLSSRNFSNR